MLIGRQIRPPVGDTTQVSSLIERAVDLHTRYQQLSSIDDLNEAIILNRDALSLCIPGQSSRPESLNNLAILLSCRYQRLGGIDDLNEAILLNRDTLSLRPPEHPDHSSSLNNLSTNLYYRFNQLGEVDDLDEAIVLDRDALSLRPHGHPDRLIHLDNLALHLSTRYYRLGEVEGFNEGITLYREALSLRPPGHPDRSVSLSNLALHLATRYKLLEDIGDLNEAIVLHRDALLLRPPGHPDRSMSLDSIAVNLCCRYKQLGEVDDLNEAIILGRDALSLRPSGNPDRLISLDNLALYLSTRCHQLGEVDGLSESITLYREVLSLRPPGHPDRALSLNNLSVALCHRYNHLGEVDDLDEAIILDRDVLLLHPYGHSDRPMHLNNLAVYLFTRYNLWGRIDDLNEAIVLNQTALSLRTPGDSGYFESLDNLAVCLSARYNLLRGIDDINTTIVLHRNALSLRPHGHPDRSAPLHNLAMSLARRSNHLGGIDDLNEAIILNREALSLYPSGHPNRSRSLDNLSVVLATRYIQQGEINDLDEAIVLDQDALSLRPPGHPDRPASLNNSAADFFYRFERLGKMNDLDEAIVLSREAFSLHPHGHPSRSTSLSNLTHYLSSRYGLLRGIEDKHELFSLCGELELVSQTVTSGDLSAAKAWINAAEKWSHHTTLLAYETALRLLVEHLAALPSLPKHLEFFKSLSLSLAVDAFSACLRNQSPSKAVELLEHGRAVFWGQLACLRSPLDNIIASGLEGKELAEKYTRLTLLVRHTLNSSSPDQPDRICSLNLELEKVVSMIRALHGFSRFLLPSPFSDLQTAAKDGPVIIMNSSEYGCDALVVLSDEDPIHIPLALTRQDVRELTARLRTLSRVAKRMNIQEIEKEFMIFLRNLWDQIVSYVVDVLQKICPRNSRIWWCPTAEFSLLPLHAAAPYRPRQKSLSDLYVSSYTTTLTALIRARRPSLHDSASERPRIVAIGQSVAKGATELLNVSSELVEIGQLVNGHATFTCIEREDSCISTVADELGKNEWAHFACHGVSKQERPFGTAFALHDGGFTLEHISRCDLQNSDFAYLSACHTTVGDQDSPDEAIHLASAMQFAGFRSVIGTMWAVDDSQTDKVISMFYKFMIDGDGRLDYTRAARALRMTKKNVDVSLDQRVLYIHLGA